MYKLTEEGEKYITRFLPEKGLLKFIGAGRSLEEVKNFENAEIAIGWAKKNNWIKIENNFVELTEEGRNALFTKTKLEIAMDEIRKRGYSDDNESIKVLISRRLIEEVKEPKIRKKLSIFDKIKMIFSKKKEDTSEIAQLTPDLIKSGKWKESKFRRYDINAPAPKVYAGKKQPYMQFIEDIRLRLIGLGFKEMRGPLVETFFWNMDALFMPQDHPGRSIHDVLILKNPSKGILPDKNLVAKVKATHEGGWITESTGWGGVWSEEEASKLLLRSQTTSVSARTLYEKGDVPGKYFTIHRNFRHDIIDYKHLADFDQCEGIVVGENLTFRHLLGFLKEISDAMGIEKIKFKPGYFPFTSPSVELYAYFPKVGWIESGGAGMLRPEVLRPLGIEKSQVLAWGLGIGRLGMIKLEVDDIRMLYSEDLEWLRNRPLVK